MEKNLKARLKKEIEVCLLKHPGADIRQVKDFILLGDSPPDMSMVKNHFEAHHLL